MATRAIGSIDRIVFFLKYPPEIAAAVQNPHDPKDARGMHVVNADVFEPWNRP